MTKLYPILLFRLFIVVFIISLILFTLYNIFGTDSANITSDTYVPFPTVNIKNLPANTSQNAWQDKIYPCYPNQNDCDPGFKCTLVSTSDHYYVNNEPLIAGNSYCLPSGLGENESKCNPYTGQILLEYENGVKTYECNCKYPELFGDGSSGCTKKYACNSLSLLDLQSLQDNNSQTRELKLNKQLLTGNVITNTELAQKWVWDPNLSNLSTSTTDIMQSQLLTSTTPFDHICDLLNLPNLNDIVGNVNIEQFNNKFGCSKQSRSNYECSQRNSDTCLMNLNGANCIWDGNVCTSIDNDDDMIWLPKNYQDKIPLWVCDCKTDTDAYISLPNDYYRCHPSPCLQTNQSVASGEHADVNRWVNFNESDNNNANSKKTKHECESANYMWKTGNTCVGYDSDLEIQAGYCDCPTTSSQEAMSNILGVCRQTDCSQGGMIKGVELDFNAPQCNCNDKGNVDQQGITSLSKFCNSDIFDRTRMCNDISDADTCNTQLHCKVVHGNCLNYCVYNDDGSLATTVPNGKTDICEPVDTINPIQKNQIDICNKQPGGCTVEECNSIDNASYDYKNGNCALIKINYIKCQTEGSSIGNYCMTPCVHDPCNGGTCILHSENTDEFTCNCVNTQGNSIIYGGYFCEGAGLKQGSATRFNPNVCGASYGESNDTSSGVNDLVENIRQQGTCAKNTFASPNYSSPGWSMGGGDGKGGGGGYNRCY